MLLEISVGGSDDTHIHLNFVHAAKVHEFSVLEHAENLALRVQAHGANLVQEKRPAISDFKQAFLGRNSAGECAFYVPEERGFKQVGRHGACINWNEGAVAARRMQVNSFGDELFAGPALTLQQHRGTAGGDLRYQIENLQHGLALAHNIFEVVTLLQRSLELDIFFFRSMPGDCGSHVGEQLLVIPRFLDEVAGAGLHRPHCVLNRAVSRDHNHGEMRIVSMNLGEKVNAIAVGQRQVEQNKIEAPITKASKALFTAAGGFHCVALKLQQSFQRFADGSFVVDDQHCPRA